MITYDHNTSKRGASPVSCGSALRITVSKALEIIRSGNDIMIQNATRAEGRRIRSMVFAILQSTREQGAINRLKFGKG